MAFTNSPALDTYSVHDFPITRAFGGRDGLTTKDAYVENFVYDIHKNTITGENEIYLKKRAGTLSMIAATGASGNVRGVYHWPDQGRYYICIENDIYVYNTSTLALVTTLSNIWATTSGPVGFAEFLYDTGTVKLVAVDGSRLLTIDSANTVVTSADADLPAHVPAPVFIDGYLLLLKTSTADIYNSDLNDPTSWTAGNFITAEMRPDHGMTISFVNNYLVVLGRRSIEFFYDAGIEDGSPFQRNASYSKQIGYVGGLAKFGDSLLFVGAYADANPSVFIMTETDIKDIGPPALRRFFADNTLTITGATMYGNIVSVDGYDHYVFYNSNGTPPTYVCNLQTLMWTRWAYKATSEFQLLFAMNGPQGTVASQPMLVFDGDRAIHVMSISTWNDNGTAFTCTLVTENEDFGTYNQKYMHNLILVTDRPVNSVSASVSWSDDDYISFSTPRTIALNQEYPSLDRLGRFRRRALKITLSNSNNEIFRLKKVSVAINKGNT